MDQYLDSASDVTAELFGPDSGIPWWAWVFVLIALFWKVIMPQPQSVRELADERDAAMLDELDGLDGGGKKAKK
jgi:hypothetical protein